MKTTLITLIVLFFSSFILAQDRTLTHFNSVPQSVENNPSFTTPYKFYLAFPGLSSFRLDFQNPFSYNSAVKRRADDSLYIDQEGFLKSFNKNNIMSIDIRLNVLDFGFRVKNNFFTFTQSFRTHIYYTYPGDLMQLLLKGNASFLDKDEPVEFKRLRINAAAYTETAIGYQRNLTDRINIGLRLKYLQGFANVNTEDSYFYLYTNPNNYHLTAKGHFGVNIASVSDMDGNIDWMSFTKNAGYAIDLGAQYRILDELAVGASLLDIGFIRWKTNPQQFSGGMINEEFVFTGVGLESFFENQRINSDVFQEIADTLSNQFIFNDTLKNAYTTWLPAKFCADAYFIYKKNNKFGAFFRNDFTNGIIIPSFTLSYQRRFGRILQIGASYGITRQHYSKIGLGMSLKLGPFHSFITTENIISYTNVAKLQNLYIHFGTNLVFGKWRETLLDKNKSSIEF